MYIERKEYLDKLVGKMWNGRIKVVAGLRRSGKSFLLFDIFKKHLLASGVPGDNIIELNLESIENEEFTDPKRLYEHVKSKICGKTQEYYVLLDEIQYAISSDELKNKDRPPRLYAALNGLLAMKNVDVYVTGSNSKLLSVDIMTEFRGRGDVINLYPLSFKEFLPVSGKDKEEAFNDYMLFGGLPLVLGYDNFEDKAAYLEGLYDEIYFKDIVERYKIQRPEVLASLTDVLCSQLGSLVNINKLTDTVNSVMNLKKGEQVANATISSYAGHLESAFLFSYSKRYDIRGRKYFESQGKYYASDTGLRNARLHFRQVEQTHLLEGVIYNYLKQRGFLVDVGMLEKNEVDDGKHHVRSQYEIDFVVNKGMYQYYIQSAFMMDSPEKKRRELYPFSITGNSFKKILVSRYEALPHYDEDGVFHVGVIDFLLNDYLSD